jgi:hypothetical protein
MTWRRDKLPELVRAMSGRPRHEALRGHVTELLREGFGAPYDEIAHELYLLDPSWVTEPIGRPGSQGALNPSNLCAMVLGSTRAARRARVRSA